MALSAKTSAMTGKVVAAPSVAGKTILVTGAAQGLGAAIAEELAVNRAQVVIGDIQSDKVSDQIHRYAAMNLEVKGYTLNVAMEADIRSVVSKVYHEYGSLDAIINNAGVDVTKSVDEISVEEWDRVMAVNLRGPFIMSKVALEVMRAGGHIVNIASTAAKRAWKNATPYHASKWGLLGFTYALFTEARDRNIKVTAVVAGGMRTPFLLDRFPDIDPGTLQDPKNVARVIRTVLELPAETVIPEVMVIPMRETSWP